jgi:protein-S-isoprenylcysteine O-methyltransferase Ste14
VLFVAYWTVSGLSTKRTVERKSVASSLGYRLLTVAGALLLVSEGPRLNLGLPAPVAGNVGAAVCVVGLFCAIWARVTLAGNWSSDVTFKESHMLVERGPYRFVRHPIYTSMLLMCLGCAIDRERLASWIGLGVILTGLWIKLRQEEVLLTRHFPDAYPTYQARVKALVPFLF